jgi:hypothetical protein
MNKRGGCLVEIGAKKYFSLLKNDNSNGGGDTNRFFFVEQ